MRIRQDLDSRQHLEPQMAEVEAERQRLRGTALWVEHMPYLLPLPGFGLVDAMTVVAAMGDIRRFPTAKKRVGYAGLGVGVHSRGQTYQTGRIPKSGRREVRVAVVEAAWSAVRWSASWRAPFERLTKRRGERQAIVAIARQLLVIVWHVLTDREAEHRVEEATVAYKLWRWAGMV